MLKKLILENFGKFNYKEIDLDQNITVIYGKNEAGKSTILDGIEYALFGKTRSERKYKGKVTLSFYYKEKMFSISNGKINGYPLYTIIKEFKELPLWLFESLFFVRTKELSITEKQGNKTFVSMMEKKLWGEVNFDIIVEKFRHSLGSYLNKFGENFKKKGELIEGWEEAQRKKETTLKMIEDAKRLKNIEIEYQIYLKNKEKWRDELNRLSNLKKKEEYEKKIAINRKIKEEKREITLLETELSNYKKIEEELQDIQKLKQQQEKLEKKIEINKIEERQIQEGIKNYMQMVHKKYKRDVIILFTAVALCIILFFLDFKVFAILGLIFLFGGIYNLFKLKKCKYKEGNEKLSKLKQKNEELKQRWQELEKKIKDILCKNRVKSIIELKALEEKGRKLKDEIRLCEERLKIWQKDAPSQEEEQAIMANLEKMEKLTGKYDEERFLKLSENLRHLQQEMEENRQKKGELRHALENKDESEILKQLKITEEEIENIENKIEALGIAYKILKDIQKETGEKIKYIVEQEAAPIFSSITKNHYSMLRYNEQMKNIEAVNDKTLPALHLSDGTRDQLYLSLRIAFVRNILENEAFFIMDEPFLTSDDDRRRKIIDTLFNLNHCQFIISIKDKDTYSDFLKKKAKGVFIQ
jgi:DNA repair exonuclease SbcCD ATPase subunit